MMNSDDQKIIALYKQTREQQPKQAMDDKILAAARQRVSQKPKTRKRVIWALSSVAVLVLSVNVALKLVINPDNSQTSLAPLSSEQEEYYETFDAVKKPITLKKQQLKNELKRKKIKVRTERSMMPRMMQAPMAQDLSTSSMMADENMILQLPYFPFSVKQLLVRFPSLSAKQTTPNDIQINKDGTRVLSLKKVKKKIIISAYPNSRLLGLDIDWSLKPLQLNDCYTVKTTTQCPLNPIQTAFFEHNQLIKVTWVQH